MCDSGGEPITYKELMPPEQLAYRKALMSFVDPSRQIPQYPGAIPYTQPFNEAQTGAMDILFKMANMGNFETPTLPPMPANIGWGDVPFNYYNGFFVGGDGGGGNGINGGGKGGDSEDEDPGSKKKKPSADSYDPYRAR